MKTVSCGEAGLCCQRRTEEVIKNGAEHAMKVHGMKEEDMEVTLYEDALVVSGD